MSATPAYPIFPEWLPQLSRQSSSAHAPSSGWQTACRQGICSICPQVTSNEKLNGHIAMKCQNHLNSVLEHTYACRSIGCVASKLCVSWIAVAPHAVHNKSIPNTHRHMCIRRDAYQHVHKTPLYPGHWMHIPVSLPMHGQITLWLWFVKATNTIVSSLCM